MSKLRLTVALIDPAHLIESQSIMPANVSGLTNVRDADRELNIAG
jgi:hypothetical protein